MNIFRRILNKIFGIPPVPPEPMASFGRPVSVSMRMSSTIQKPDPMAASIERARRDAKKTAVVGSVASASRSTTQPDPMLDPLNPLSPLSPLSPIYADPDRETTRHHVDHSSVGSHSNHSSHDYSSSHSSYDHSSSSHDSGSYDSGSHSSHDSSNY